MLNTVPVLVQQNVQVGTTTMQQQVMNPDGTVDVQNVQAAVVQPILVSSWQQYITTQTFTMLDPGEFSGNTDQNGKRSGPG